MTSRSGDIKKGEFTMMWQGGQREGKMECFLLL